MTFSSRTKYYITETICLLFILLFIYASASKLMDFQHFRIQLGQSPLLSAFAEQVAVIVPAAEGVFDFYDYRHHRVFYRPLSGKLYCPCRRRRSIRAQSDKPVWKLNQFGYERLDKCSWNGSRCDGRCRPQNDKQHGFNSGKQSLFSR